MHLILPRVFSIQFFSIYYIILVLKVHSQEYMTCGEGQYQPHWREAGCDSSGSYCWYSFFCGDQNVGTGPTCCTCSNKEEVKSVCITQRQYVSSCPEALHFWETDYRCMPCPQGRRKCAETNFVVFNHY